MDPMEAIKATFFQECDELLADLESGLLTMQEGVGDGETVNAVFRAVHSIKGGAGAFGLDALVRFAHVFESTMDQVRNGDLVAGSEVVGVLLRAADRLADLVAASKAGASIEDRVDGEIVAALQALSSTAPVDGVEDDLDIPGFVPMQFEMAPLTAACSLSVSFRPNPELYAKANDPVLLVREMRRLGEVGVELDRAALPLLQDLDPFGAYLSWTFEVSGQNVSEAAVRDVFEFVDGDCDLLVSTARDPGVGEATDGDDFSLAAVLAAAGLGDALTGRTESVLADAPAGTQEEELRPSPAARSQEARPGAANPPAEAHGATTIRVDLERVDRLIDLVGELVINQAMLAQRVVDSGLARSSAIALGLDDFEQITREIQDSVMAIRAQPVKSVFQRMPRLVRDTASMVHKKVRLVTEGEATEVDKTVIERLTDPLTHMIRNAIDHGLETREGRQAAGKPEEGLIRLSARHRSGRILIEVSDDGRGIDRERVRAIAVERGLVDAGTVLTDEEIDNLIFAPGFSTASQVSDISGRGVGMDVVKRSIQALGGRIAIASRPGEGSVFSLSLPLTLAVLDGMVVSVGAQTLVVPITAIVETLQPKASDIRLLGPTGAVVSVRGAYVPLIDVASSLGWTSDSSTLGVTLLVETGAGLAALRVDAIQGQRQVVIKSLAQNYDQVDDIAAATILGDGRVALILDVDSLVARRKRSGPTTPAPISKAS